MNKKEPNSPKDKPEPRREELRDKRFDTPPLPPKRKD